MPVCTKKNGNNEKRLTFNTDFMALHLLKINKISDMLYLWRYIMKGILLYSAVIFLLLFFFVSCEVDEEPYIGTWIGDNVDNPGGEPPTMDLILTFEKDGDYTALVCEDYNDELSIQDGANSGTYTEADGVITINLLLQYQDGEWVDVSGMGASIDISYSIDGNSMTLVGDFDGDEENETIGPLIKQ
jgi:hypothetical protein